ncbi:BspA family leucine-rich repeat surface protein [Acinetobacter sp. ANC 5502]
MVTGWFSTTEWSKTLMVNLVGKKLWSDVRLLESHEYAQGGENGNMNEQAKALLNRTEYLRGLLEQLQQTQQSQQDWQTQFSEQISQLGQQISQINLKLEQLGQPSTPQQPSISCEGATAQVQLMNDSDFMLYNSISAIIVDGVSYAKQGWGDYGLPEGILAISTERLNGNNTISFKNLDSSDHRIELVGYTGDIADPRLGNDNPTLARNQSGNVIFCLAGFNLLNISCVNATHQVAVNIGVDEGGVDGLYSEITLNQQSYRIDAVADQRFYDTFRQYISQNLGDWLLVRDYQALDPNIAYDPNFVFLVENISDQPLRVQLRTSSDSTSLTGDEYADVGFITGADNGYNPTVGQLDQNANAKYGNYSVCLNPLSEVQIESDAENTIQAQLLEGMLISENIQQIQFANGDVLNLNTGLSHISAERAGLALCILKADTDQNSDVRLGGPALAEIVSYPTRALNRIWHAGSSATQYLPAYKSIHLSSVPDQCPNVRCLDSMFSGCEIFNDVNLSNWDVSQIESLNYTFWGTLEFNQPLNWSVSQVSNFTGTFAYSAFNQALQDWDVSNGTMFWSMFEGNKVFNQSLSAWNTKNAQNMNAMFYNAAAFQQDLSLWCVTHVTVLPDQFAAGSPLSSNHYPVWGTCPRGEASGVSA